jgi:DNA polymerase III alpha subunit
MTPIRSCCLLMMPAIIISHCARAGCQCLGLALCSRGGDGAPARTIRYGLGGVKGVGAQAVEHLIARRDSGGPLRKICLIGCARVGSENL